jgi:hypothetical protein
LSALVVGLFTIVVLVVLDVLLIDFGAGDVGAAVDVGAVAAVGIVAAVDWVWLLPLLLGLPLLVLPTLLPEMLPARPEKLAPPMLPCPLMLLAVRGLTAAAKSAKQKNAT